MRMIFLMRMKMMKIYDEPLPDSVVEDLFSKLQADGESDSY